MSGRRKIGWVLFPPSTYVFMLSLISCATACQKRKRRRRLKTLFLHLQTTPFFFHTPLSFTHTAQEYDDGDEAKALAPKAAQPGNIPPPRPVTHGENEEAAQVAAARRMGGGRRPGLSTHPPGSAAAEEEEEEGVRNLNAQAAKTKTKFLSPSSSAHGGGGVKGAAQIVSLIGASSALPPPPTTKKKELGYGLGGGAAAKIPGPPPEGSLVSGVVGSDIRSDFACVCVGDESVLSGAGDLEEDKSPVNSSGFDFDLGLRPFSKFNKSSRRRKSADRGAETPVRGDCYKMASSNSSGFNKVKSPPPAFRPPPPFSPPPAAPSPVAGAAAASSPLAQRKLSAALNSSSNSGSSSNSNKRPVERLEGDKITRFGEPGIIHF